MKNTHTIRLFGILLATIVVQEVVNWAFKEYFIVGIIPTALFGTIWNLKNGERIYEKVKYKDEFEMSKFRTLSVLSIIYLVVYIVLFNIFVWPPDNNTHSPGNIFFWPFSGLSGIFAIYAWYYNIGFVTRGLKEFYPGRWDAFLTIISLIFFPIGIWWVQPRVDLIKK